MLYADEIGEKQETRKVLWPRLVNMAECLFRRFLQANLHLHSSDSRFPHALAHLKMAACLIPQLGSSVGTQRIANGPRSISPAQKRTGRSVVSSSGDHTVLYFRQLGAAQLIH